MVSLLVDLVICALLLGTGYLLFVKPGDPSKASRSGKKKKKAKGKKGGGGEEAVSDGTKAKAEGLKQEKPAVLAKKDGQQLQPAKAKQAAARTQPATSAPDNADFPSLQAASAKQPTSKNGNDSHPRPLAERMAKKPRKTAVDDMLEPDDELHGKTFKRTMRIVKPEADKPTIIDQPPDDEEESDSGDSYTERVEKEQAWQSIPVAQKKPATIRIGSSFSSAPSSSTPPRSVVGLTEPSKKQRQNAARAASEKAAKDAAEQDRLQRLAAHKRALERERMNSQANERERNKARQQSKTNRQNLSGGMQAKVDNGALIWE